MRFALAVFAAVQIADAQDLFIPSRQLRGSANASIHDFKASIHEFKEEAAEENTLLDIDSSTEEDVSTEWWGKMCVDKSYRQPISVNWWSPRRWCRNLDGDRILKIAAKFWSDDDLIFQVDTGYMEPGRNTCVYRPGRRWNYRGNSWKEIDFEFRNSRSGYYQKTCLSYRFLCVRPFTGRKCTVHISKMELGDTWKVIR